MARASSLLLASLALIANAPDLLAQSPSSVFDALTPAQQAAIKESCELRRHSGQDTVDACIAQQAAALRGSVEPADLRSFSPADQVAIRDACRVRRYLGPAAVSACLAEQSAALHASEGPPDLSLLPQAEQSAIRETCNRLRYSGPAAVHACQRAAASRGQAGVLPTTTSRTEGSPIGAGGRPALVGSPRTGAGIPGERASAAGDRRAQPGVELPAVRRAFVVLIVTMLGVLVALSFLRELRRGRKCGICHARATGSDRLCDACREASRAPSDRQPPPPPKPEEPDPYTVLGVPRDATRAQIRKAYLRLMTKYHPDKVAQLGPERRRAATRKSQDINIAYALLMRV